MFVRSTFVALSFPSHEEMARGQGMIMRKSPTVQYLFFFLFASHPGTHGKRVSLGARPPKVPVSWGRASREQRGGERGERTRPVTGAPTAGLSLPGGECGAWLTAGGTGATMMNRCFPFLEAF